MARTVNQANRTIRRDTFVDAAQRLIASKGYEQMSIQDVLDALGASRGAFYHYFDSKAALLEAVLNRTVVEATANVERIQSDSSISALAKLSRLLTDIAEYKNERQDLDPRVSGMAFGRQRARTRQTAADDGGSADASSGADRSPGLRRGRVLGQLTRRDRARARLTPARTERAGQRTICDATGRPHNA